MSKVSEYIGDIKTIPEKFSIEGGTITGGLTVAGGDIVLGGSGRIQGIDIITDVTDAVSKSYVDNAINEIDFSGVLSDDGKNLSTNGYQILSNGLIFQWGQTTASGNITFPISFKASCLNVHVTEYNYGVNGSEKVTITNVSNTGFTITRNATLGSYWYFVIGY